MVDGGGFRSSGTRSWRASTAKPSMVTGVVLILVLSGALSVVAASATAAPGRAATSGGALVQPALGTVSAKLAGNVSVSPHPGTLDVDEVAPGGVATVDPSVAYAEASLEPIMNVYETLVAYNGSSTGSFVPVAAACVPGTVQCSQDYGPNFTGLYNATGAPFTGSNGEATYWSFVLDPAAHFYDPTTRVSWPVYPSDVMFAVSRAVAFADLPGIAFQPGWMIAQTLLPNGSASWDGGIHFPYNNTPYDVLSSMYVNDSAYCPAAAMDGVHGDGCITFNASAEGVTWPMFLELAANSLGMSIEPCGWFSASAQNAGVPGFPGTAAANGDGGCLLPGNATSTSSAGFRAFLNSTLTPGGLTSWDAFEELAMDTPAIQPGVMGTMVGSGPYWGSVNLGQGYDLTASRGYEQPSGCGGNPTQFPGQYIGYCDPAPGKYIANVSVLWVTDAAQVVVGYQTGTIDFGAFSGENMSTMVTLAQQGKLVIAQATTLSTYQMSYVAFWNATDREAGGLAGLDNIPSDFFSYEAARALMQTAYPSALIEATDWTDAGLQTMLPVGGPIPVGMGCYYAPTTSGGCANNYSVPWTNAADGGIPSANASQTGTAGWWWAEGRNVSSPYYDPELAECTSATPCEFSLQSVGGYFDAAETAWISSIEAMTGGAVQPNIVDTILPSGVQGCGGPASYKANACPVYSSGWIADYPDPADQMAAYGLPNGTFVGPDAVAQQLSLPQFDNVTRCGNATPNMLDLEYWAGVANTTAIPNDCQGVAYHVFSWAMALAASMVASPTRILLYDLGQTILNALDLYTWVGQPVNYVSAAPWINPGSIDTNPMTGIWTQFWFQVNYTVVPAGSFTVFSESGLTKGTTWTVTIKGQEFSATTTKIKIYEGTGTYGYALVSGSHAYMPASRTGTFTVTRTQGTVKVKFEQVASVVTFAESGLTKGTSWSVTVGTTTLTATTSKLSFALPVGSYMYTATAPGYASVTGTFVILVESLHSIKVRFVPYNHYAATFGESGLPTGVLWTVSLKLEKGTGPLGARPGSQTSTGSTITWTDLANGTYEFTAKAAGFLPVSGSVDIQGGSAAPVTVTFTRS